jgi:hypothetical protein
VISSLYSSEESEEESMTTGDNESINCSTRIGTPHASVSDELESTARISQKIEVYNPQLNLDVYNYPLSSSFNIKMDPSPQPTLSSSSRLLSAFQKIYHSSVKQPASIAPLETVKPVSSKSSSFTDRIKNKFQAKRKSQLSMTRSGSLSSMAKRWSSNKKESSSFEIKWSISSHRPHKQSNPIYTSDHFMASRKKAVRFTKSVLVQETFSQVDYDRGSDPDAICMKLTPLMAQIIKEELNAYKLHEMQVHEKSKIHTHFFI